MKPSPKKMVESRFGTRADLVAAILPLIDGDDDARGRLNGTTNKKLLRIYEVSKEVSDRFGGKSGLIDACAKLQFANGKPNPGWREKMERWTVKKLYDHHRQLSTTGAGAAA